LCFFLALVETGVFFVVAVFFEGGLAAALFVFAGDLREVGLLEEVSEEVDDWVWAKPSPTRRKIPARTETAERRTQTLPSAENWHP
jgi:hypothetical protein